MILGCGFLTANDAAMKALVAEMPVGQAVSLRGIVSLGMLLALTPMLGGLSELRPRRWRNVMLLTALLLVNLFLFPTSLKYIPLADAIMLAYLSPLIVAATAPWLLRETVGWRRWSAVALGVVGAWLVIDPGGGGVSLAMVLPLIVAVLVGIRDILTRLYVHGESVLAIVAAASVGASVLGLASIPAGWIMPDARLWAILVVAAATLTVAQFMMAAAFRYAEAPVLSCLKYSSIAYAAALGWMFWGEALGASDWAGGALIALSGIIITLRTKTAKR